MNENEITEIIEFTELKKPEPIKEPEKKHDTMISEKATDIINSATESAIVGTITTNDTVKEKIMKTAEKIVDTEMSVLQNKADKKDRDEYFNASESACRLFGYADATTDKVHTTIMRNWIWFLNIVYICTIGMFVISPILFFAEKLSNAVKKYWLAVVLGFLIWALIIIIPLIPVWAKG